MNTYRSKKYVYQVPKYGIKITMIGGIAVSAVCCVSFGLLDYIEDPTYFAAGSFVIRMLQGLAYAAYITAVFSSVTALFKPQMGFVLVSMYKKKYFNLNR